MNGFSRHLPWFVVALAAGYLLMNAAGSEEGRSPFHLTEFGKLPVVEGGRVKPLDSVARNTMMQISNRQTFTDLADKSQPAIKWLLDVMSSRLSESDVVQKYKVFRIENDQVLNFLDLKPRPGSYRYAIDEFANKMPQLAEQASKARDREPKQRDLFDTKILELAQHLQAYIGLATLESPFVVPPAREGGEWQPLVAAFQESRQTGEDNAAAKGFGKLLLDYTQNKPEAFNQDLAVYQQQLADRLPGEVSRADSEAGMNHFAPFYQCSVLYVLVFLLACFSWVGFTQPLNRAAFWLAVLTLVVHTGALLTRMYIQNRPLVMVTNLYSSAIFIGWGCVVLGLILEWMFQNGIGNVVAAVTGALSLIIAHHLADGDTLGVMQAVLDTNFWLATHVTCVTTGYASTYLAGFLGILLILRGVLTRSLDTESYRTLGRMIYGIVCFATFFSFVGTVLGGIWADQSWGRFWGWDPKENGALIIVLWNALILHARWGGLVQQRGMAVLAVFGNVVTAWSWFGVNMLGVGLHSYGFMEGAVFWLGTFIVSQLGIMALGMLPLRLWRSFASLERAPRKPEPQARVRPAPVVAAAR